MDSIQKWASHANENVTNGVTISGIKRSLPRRVCSAIVGIFPIEFVSYDDALFTVCKRDYNYLTPGSSIVPVPNGDCGTMAFLDYWNGNVAQTYLAVNLWCSLISDLCSDRAAYNFADTIKKVGFLQLVAMADETASKFIRGVNDDNEYGEYFYPFSEIVSSLDIKTTLEVLRFPKRFTVVRARQLEERSLDSFWELQDKTTWSDNESSRVKRDWRSGVTYDRSDRFQRTLDLLRPYLADMVKYVNFDKMDKYDCSFSSGSSQDGRSILQKVHGIRKYQEFWLSPHYRLGNFRGEDNVNPEKGYAIVPTAVPKSYKAYRIIAPEDSYHNMIFGQAMRYAYSVFKAKSKYSSLINLEDQDINREACRLGSLTDELATEDITHASDSITIFHLDAFPDSYREFIQKHRAKYAARGNKKVILLTALTSGNPLTFFTESMFFLACALLATDIVKPWCKKVHKPFTYGDDMVIDSQASGALAMIFDNLKINLSESKSFVTGAYRESCGAEYYKGMDVASQYWPRKGILVDQKITAEDLSSIISLQHRLQPISWKCDHALRTFVRNVVPDMTSSQPGTDSFDLWEVIPHVIKMNAPYEDIEGRHTYDGHVACVTRSHSNVVRDPAVEMYLYANFLAHGPEPTGDPLLDLLGITLPLNRGSIYAISDSILDVIAEF